MRLFRKWTNIGLRTKLVLLIESLVILLVLAIGIIAMIREKQTLENELKKRGLALSANIANFVVRPLINQDLPSLRRFVSHSMAQDYVRYAIILDPDGKVVMHSDLEEVGKTYKETEMLALGAEESFCNYTHPHLSKQEGLHCDIFTPIQLSGVRLGTVALGYSYEAVEKQMAKVRQHILLMGLVITFIGAVAAYLLATFISTPVRRITMAVEKVAKGRPHFPLKIKRRDEIGILANSFDKMAKDLEIHRRHLEELVQERTADLERVNERLRQVISDRKEAEEALRQSEKDYRETFDAMTDWILAVDSDLRIVLFNDAFMQINKELELTTDVIGRTPMEIFPFISHTLRDEYRWVFKNKKVLITQETTKVGDREFITESRKIPLLKEGKISKVVSVIRDITERKIAEEAVQESIRRVKIAYDQSVVYAQQLKEEIEGRQHAQEAMIQAKEDWENTFDAITDIVMLLDNELQIIRVNKAAAEVLNTTKEGLVGKKCYEVIHGKSSPIGRCPLVHTMKTLEPHSTEITEPNLGGTFICSTSPIMASEGTPSGYTHTLKDVTVSKRLEAQLQQAQKMEAIGTLAGGIAHDFNNILMPIISYTEMALLQLADDSSMRFNLEQVVKAGLRARDLVQQILTFSRQSDQQRIPLNVVPIVKEALKLLRASLPKTIEIRQNIKADSGTVMASPTQIHQVLMNLCTNSGHAMREKGGVLEVTLIDVDLDSYAAAQYPDLVPGAYVKLTVSDTGHGMSREVKERIFDPFFTTKELGEGTGMGLSVVHGIVKNYGGAITVYSETGKGTTFNLFFPRIDIGDQLQAEPTEAIPAGNERILVVDDEAAITDSLRQILESIGYNVETRTSSLEALEVFRARYDNFDLVITDQTMPNMTGEILAKELMAIRSDIPIILCTGFSEIISEAKSKAIGIREFVMKPIIINELAKSVRKVLDED